MKSLAKIFCLASIVCLFMSANAADYWVSPSGLDTHSGTQASPYKTIGKAVSMVASGGTVHVAPGTYAENVHTTQYGTSTARIRYVSDSAWGAKIVGNGTEAMWTNDGDYVDIKGFDITGTGRLGILNYGSFVLVSGNHVLNLTVSGGCTGNGGAGIVNADYTASDNDIIGNVVHDIGTPGGCNGVQGIYHSCLRGHIYNNIVYRVSAYGIHLWHAANKVKIANNTVFANGSSGMGGGIEIGDGDSPGGVVLDSTVVANNIVYSNPASSIIEYCYSGENCIGPQNIITHNLVNGNGSGISLRVGTASGTITANPQFVNYTADSTGNYHLQAGSHAIDSGSAAYAPATDLDGVVRPQGRAPDIGAYEYVATGTPVEAVGPGVGPVLLAAYPNPFSRGVTVLLNGLMDQRASIVTVYDVRGKEVHSSEFKGGSYSWNPEGLPVGTYLIRVRAASGRVCETRALLLK
jgi:hypothetical protein